MTREAYVRELVRALPPYLQKGLDLRRIHASGVWRRKARTWKEYCTKELSMSKSAAYRLIQAVNTVEEMFPAYFQEIQ